MNPKNLVGRKLGPYQIMAKLGQGGMAILYHARDPQGDMIALKVLTPHPSLGQEIAARFEREAQMAAQLNHPAIVRVLDSGQDQGYAFMAMTLIKGQNLAEHLEQSDRLAEATAADIAWQIADALDYAHNQGIIHRDVKPSNILLTQDERVLLTDFGIALALDAPALTQTGLIVGTPAYMAPEQTDDTERVDRRADIYALGAVLYQMITGDMPFQGSTPQILHAHVYTPPPPPSQRVNISQPMERIILKALAKNPDHRFQTGAEMAQALARLTSQPATKLKITPIRILPPTKTLPKKSSPAERPPQLENPFFFGGPVYPELFYGREELLSLISQRVNARTAQSTSIVGERRMGKSSLLNYLKVKADHFFPPHVLIIYLDLMKAYSHTRAGLMRGLRRELTRLWQEPWSPSEDGDLSAFDFALEDMVADGLQLLLFLDEVENLTQRAEEFNDVLEDWRANAQMGQMAIVTASAQPLADLCAIGGLTSPFYNIFSQHWLGLFPLKVGRKFITDHINASATDLDFIEKVAGGHPFFTQMAASYLWEAQASSSNIDYEALYQELWFQAQPHLQHLWRRLTDEEQIVLQRAAHGETFQSRTMAALERRGIARQQKPFSHLFAEMIRENQLS